MRILHLTNMYPDPDRPFWGMFVRGQVEALRAQGVDCDVHLVDGNASRWNYLRAVGKVRDLAASGRYDILHAHYGLTGLTATGQRRLPTVLSLYGSDVNISWQRWISRLAERRAARTIVCSRRMADSLKAARVPLILPPGIDTDRFRPLDRKEARARFSCRPDETVLLFPGNPDRTVKDYPLFQAAVQALDRNNVHIITLGAIADEDLPALYCATDCVILTSKTEGSPTVIKEARACGCPVVSVDVGDVAEQVENCPMCWVTKTREPREIAARVADVLNAPRPVPTAEDRQEISLATTGRRLVEVYGSVLSA